MSNSNLTSIIENGKTQKTSPHFLKSVKKFAITSVAFFSKTLTGFPITKTSFLVVLLLLWISYDILERGWKTQKGRLKIVIRVLHHSSVWKFSQQRSALERTTTVEVTERLRRKKSKRKGPVVRLLQPRQHFFQF